METRDVLRVTRVLPGARAWGGSSAHPALVSGSAWRRRHQREPSARGPVAALRTVPRPVVTDSGHASLPSHACP